MRAVFKYFVVLVAIVLVGVVGYSYLSNQTIALLQTKGTIAEKQRNLIYLATALMLIVVIPVYFMAFWFPKRYSEKNQKSEYLPDWDNNKILESIWWGVPILIIGIIATVTWISSHELDPFKPLASADKQKKIQVIAMEWKWLFIYPEEGIVSVNYLAIPKDQPVEFEITADAAMNSFWIPQLGGQIYAMNGMATKLHLVGNEVGVYEGMSSNISGYGFSDMRFKTAVVDSNDYNYWVRQVKESGNEFGALDYKQLTIPSVANVQQQFKLSSDDIFSSVISKYTDPSHRISEEYRDFHLHLENI